jgi:hypothetical protein
MKRCVAALATVALGLGGALTAVAPAQAAIAPCATSDDQLVAADATTNDFYLECMPQYGIGKAEFEITSDTAFSTEFDLGLDEFATVESTVDDAAATAYLFEEFRGGFANLSPTTIDGADPATQEYSAEYAAFPISGATRIDDSALPAGCLAGGATFEGAYRVDFAPITTVYTTAVTSGQTPYGQPGTFTVSSTPAPLYLGLNFDGADFFDITAPLCASGDQTLLGSGGTNAWYAVTERATRPRPTIYPSPTHFGVAALETTVTPPTITTSSLPAATAGTPYSTTVAATGGGLTYTAAGALPAGLSLHPSTGMISGTPTALGTSAFSVSVANALGSASTGFTITTAGIDPSVVLTSTNATYGRAASVTVNLGPGPLPLTGTVAATVDGAPASVGAIAGNTAAVTLPTTLAPGVHTVSVSYSGDSAHLAATASTGVTVGKAAANTTLKLKKKAVRGKSKLKATVRVTVPGTAVTPTGKAVITVNGKRVKTVTLKNGRATVKLPPFAKRGNAKVVASYLGSTFVTKDRSPVSKVRVR